MAIEKSSSNIGPGGQTKKQARPAHRSCPMKPARPEENFLWAGPGGPFRGLVGHHYRRMYIDSTVITNSRNKVDFYESFSLNLFWISLVILKGIYEFQILTLMEMRLENFFIDRYSFHWTTDH